MDSNLDKIKKILILLKIGSKEREFSKYFARMVMARVCRNPNVVCIDPIMTMAVSIKNFTYFGCYCHHLRNFDAEI